MTERLCGFGGLSFSDVLLRVTGSPLVGGNAVRILRDGKENYPEWEAAIGSAQKTIHVEMYIIHNDRTGRRFRDLLAAKARGGVAVRVLCDWFGSFGTWRMWRPLVDAGGDVRYANPPRFGSLLGWVSRDHRKLLTIDGSLAFISGLCVGDAWAGDGGKKDASWRDTGVVIRGPAVTYAEEAFAAAWRLAGLPVPAGERSPTGEAAREGDVDLRIVATSPEIAGLYRLDLLIAAVAKDYLWLTDAYFLGTSPYIQSLRSAAMDGVDVRLLVPRGGDIQWIANISRTMYRSLLEAGVRVFEWNGIMMHAKTAVCDDRMVRIGSTNLNVASWNRNWELDVVIEDKGLAEATKEMFLEDFYNSTEIVITGLNKVRPARPLTPTGKRIAASSGGKSVIAGVVKVGSALNSAVTGRRELSRAESASLLSIGWLLLLFAIAGVFFPGFIVYPLAAILGWAGIFCIVKGLQLRFWKGRRKGRQSIPQKKNVKTGGAMKNFLCLVFLLAVWFPCTAYSGSAQCAKYQVRLEGKSSVVPGCTYTEILEMRKVGEASGYEGRWQVDRFIQINTYFWQINPPLASTSRVDFGNGQWMDCSAHTAGNVFTNECSGGQLFFDVNRSRIGWNTTGVWIGTIQGNTASLRFDSSNPASPTIVGQIQQPAKRNLTLDIILQKDRFVFDGNTPGVLEMELEAKVSPPQHQNQVQWTIPVIDGSTRLLDPPSATGGKIKVTYKGLPDDNGEFGPKTIKATVNVDGCRAEDSKQVKVFYPRDAKNNPDGQYPNWFYYWKQTPAAKPRGQLVNIEYGGSTYNECVNPKVPAQYTPGAGHATIHVCDLSRLGQDFQNRFPVLSLQSPYHLGWETSRHIDTFAKCVIHEYTHWLCYHNFRYGKTPQAIAAADTDLDGLPDTAESQYHFDPQLFQTHMSAHGELKNIGGDEEWLAYASMSEVPAGKYNKYDWGKPGSQWP